MPRWGLPLERAVWSRPPQGQLHRTSQARTPRLPSEFPHDAAPLERRGRMCGGRPARRVWTIGASCFAVCRRS